MTTTTIDDVKEKHRNIRRRMLAIREEENGLRVRLMALADEKEDLKAQKKTLK